MVTSSTLLSDTILFVRNVLRTNITDPLTGSRVGSFVMTSYPKEAVQYPLITVRGKNDGDQKLGQQCENSLVKLTIEVRVWAKSEKQKNNLTDDVYNFLRTNQYPSTTANTSTNEQLWDFGINFANDIDENGEEAVKSKLMEFRYSFITS